MNRLAILILAGALAVTGEPASTAAWAAEAAPAPAPEYRIEHVSLEEGVSHNLVFALHQDSRGFLWFGTMYGLVRYDGRSYRTWRHDPRNPESLSNDDIVSIMEDGAGNIWASTYGGGVNRLDPRTGRINRYLPAGGDNENGLAHGIVWDMCEDGNGAVWVAPQSAGLDRLDPATGEVRHFVPDEENESSLGAGGASTLLIDRRGALWVGTRTGGLCRLDSEEGAGSFTRFTHDPEDAGSLAGNSITALFEDREGTIWVGTQGAGLDRFDPEAGRFEHLRHAEGDRRSLPSDFVNVITEDRRGRIWVGTPAGMARIDGPGGAMTVFTHHPDDRGGIRSDNVVALLEDRSGVIWAGSYHGGLDRFVPNYAPFDVQRHVPGDDAGLAHDVVLAFLEDRSGALWVGTAGGLSIESGRRGVYRNYRAGAGDPAGIGGRRVRALLEDRRGAVWAGTSGGLSRFEAATGRFRTWRNDPDDDASLSDSRISALVEDRSGRFWVGTLNGLNRFDRASGTAVRYLHDRDDPNSLAENTVLSLFEDRENCLWIGTFGGLCRLEPGSGDFTLFRQDPSDPGSISNNYAYSYYEDPTGVLWIGTGGGLNRFDRDERTFEFFSERDGLPNGVICGIAPDGDGALWLSTNRGICRFDPGSGESRVYDATDGLPSNLFSTGAALRRRSGEILFGGIRGFVSFLPGEFGRNTAPPAMAITAFRHIDRDGHCWTGGPAAPEIYLPHDENYFSFEFAALDFVKPERNRYSWMLEGLDPGWIDGGTENAAHYTNVPPGDYRFRVRGSNGDGVWCEEEAGVRVTVTPPFWRTWWFATLVALAAAAAGGAWHTGRTRSRVRRAIEVEKARKLERERVRRKAASDFHDELGHRLTRIGLFSEMVKRKLGAVSDEAGSYLDKIIDEARNLTNDTRDFIWTLGPGRETLYDLVIYLKDFGDELFDRTDIDFRVEGIFREMESLRLSMDTRRHTTFIFKEGMHNALKHAACRSVRLSAAMEGDDFTLTLVDDGKGYERNIEHSGNGLKNMKSRAEKIDGTIRFDSKPGEGASVRLEVRP